jgi:hypothetical protein
MDALHALTDADLGALAAALRSGRLHPPYSVVAVQRFCAADPAAAVAGGLQQLDAEGMLPRHLALLAEAVLQTRARLPAGGDLVELVWTGPEAPGTVNRDTSVVVRDLFGIAESDVLVAGFAVYQGREVFRRLAERMAERPALRVRLCLDIKRAPGDSAPDEELLRLFAERFRSQEWPGDRLPAVFYDPRSLDLKAVKRSSLHAKCIVVDHRIALVTSANFTEAAQTRNIEAGALSGRKRGERHIRGGRREVRRALYMGALAVARVPGPLRDLQLNSLVRPSRPAAQPLLCRRPPRGWGRPAGVPL